ncbi:MAG: Periplasmic molybdenum ABC transporter, partial [Leptospirillum sp. Group IV 'UBA BS']
AQAGFLSLSQARSLGRRVKGDFVALSPLCAPALPQEMGIVARTRKEKEARAFESYIMGADAQGYLKKHGYH